MKFFFQETFIKEVKKLLKKTSYKDCEEAIIKDIFIINSDDVFDHCSAVRLNTSENNPIGKLRIAAEGKGKSSSYRLYLLALKVQDKMYFAYILPKTGVFGKSALTSKEQKVIIKNLLDCIKSDTKLKEVALSKSKDKIIYTKDNKNVF
jgi:hypothetical protein